VDKFNVKQNKRKKEVEKLVHAGRMRVLIQDFS